jgi:hypothetical protein
VEQAETAAKYECLDLEAGRSGQGLTAGEMRAVREASGVEGNARSPER